MAAPACGYLREQGEPPVLQRCDNPATCAALSPELDDYIPACEECAADKQTRRVPG